MESCDKVKEQVGASPSDKVSCMAGNFFKEIVILLQTCVLQGDSKVKDVVVNGKKQSLDLVALICYHKLKQKCQGWCLLLFVALYVTL